MKEAILQQKQGIVEDIKAKFENCQSAILIDYRGLTVEEVTDQMCIRDRTRCGGKQPKAKKREGG